MDSPKPPLTVLMPAYNAERYIVLAIQSILDQTFGDFELLVIDDGSTDRTGEIVRAFTDPRVRLIRNETNLRMAATLNRGLQLVRSEIIARMDADDVAVRNRFALQMRYLNDHPEMALVGTGMTLIDEEGRKIGASVPVTDVNLLRWRNQFANQIAHPTTMFRRSVLDRLQLRYGTLPDWVAQPAGLASVNHLSEDYLMFGLLALRESVGNIRDALLQYRVHEQSVSGSQAHAQINTAYQVSALLIGQIVERPVAPELAKLVYFTRPRIADQMTVEAACELIDCALARHAARFKLLPTALAPLKRDAELRKGVLRSAGDSIWRRVWRQLARPILPRDREDCKLMIRSLVSERCVARLKAQRSRFVVG